MRRDRFRAGSGCYTCGSCGKLTRDTGNDEAGVRLCRRCYDEAGEENAHADGHHRERPSHDCPLCRAAAPKAPEPEQPK